MATLADRSPIVVGGESPVETDERAVARIMRDSPVFANKLLEQVMADCPTCDGRYSFKYSGDWDMRDSGIYHLYECSHCETTLALRVLCPPRASNSEVA